MVEPIEIILYAVIALLAVVAAMVIVVRLINLPRDRTGRGRKLRPGESYEPDRRR